MKGDEIYTNTFNTNFKMKKIHYIVQKNCLYDKDSISNKR